MSRAGLIEAICRTAYNRQYAPARWEDAPATVQEGWRELASEDAEGVIEFVAEWLSKSEWACCRDQHLTERWRKDMMVP